MEWNKKFSKALRGLVVTGSAIAGQPDAADAFPKTEHSTHSSQMEDDTRGGKAQERKAAEMPTAPNLLSRLFNVEDFIPEQDNGAERHQLAQELYELVKSKAPVLKDGSQEMLFPLKIGEEKAHVRALIFPSAQEMRLVVFWDNHTAADTAIFLRDLGITGTPTEHQLPIEESGEKRYQTFLSAGALPVANKVYLGLLRQILSKY